MGTKMKVFLIFYLSWVFATMSMFMFVPSSWWVGCDIWYLVAVWILWTILPPLAIGCVWLVWRILFGVVQMQREKEQRYEDEMVLCGRGYRYIGRDVICKASGKSFARR